MTKANRIDSAVPCWVLGKSLTSQLTKRAGLLMNLQLQPSEGESADKYNGYASLIGSLMYLAMVTRSDIAYAVFQLGSYMANPAMSHWTAAKQVLRYLSGTRDYGITYQASETKLEENHFLGYSDASYANNDDATSISGYVFIMHQQGDNFS